MPDWHSVRLHCRLLTVSGIPCRALLWTVYARSVCHPKLRHVPSRHKVREHPCRLGLQYQDCRLWLRCSNWRQDSRKRANVRTIDHPAWHSRLNRSWNRVSENWKRLPRPMRRCFQRWNHLVLYAFPADAVCAGSIGWPQLQVDHRRQRWKLLGVSQDVRGQSWPSELKRKVVNLLNAPISTPPKALCDWGSLPPLGQANCQIASGADRQRVCESKKLYGLVT